MRPARHRRRAALLVALTTLLAGVQALPEASAGRASACLALGDGCVVVVDPLRTVRPTQEPSGTAGAHVVAARGEFESFQVVVGAAGDDLTRVRVGPAQTLTGPGGAIIPAGNVTIYREAYYRVLETSDLEGRTGLWPDALIPTVDRFYREPRNAFPVKVPAGENRVAWVDVLVPPDAVPGRYTGVIRVRADGVAPVDVPISVRVIDLTLRPTPHLQSLYGFSSYVCQAHFGNQPCSNEQRWELNSLYIRAGLDDRITITPPPFDPPRDQATRDLFVTYMLPLLQGTEDGLQLDGARLQGVLEFPLFVKQDGDGNCCVANDDNACPAACLNTYRSLAEQFGFVKRFVIVPRDEPRSSPEAWEMFRRNRKRALELWPALGTRGVMGTTAIQFSKQFGTTGLIDVMAPLINQMQDKPGSPFQPPDLTGNQRAEYEPFLDADPARRLWLYNSCQSYGCGGGIDSDTYYRGWAGYAIDEPASEQRAMPWLAFTYRASGEHYYDVASTLRTTDQGQVVARPWSPGGQDYQGGNGDGNLFYPGIPDPAARGITGVPAIGGVHDIPIESIRLKRIRDGYEDYEYLRFAANHGHASEARQIALDLFPTTYRTAVTASAFAQARAKLVQLVTS